MKLGKMWLVLVGIFLIVAVALFQFSQFQTQLNSSFQPIIAAKVDIKKGERITNDKIGLIKVAKPTPIPGTSNPADVLGKIAPYDIKKGEPIIPSKLVTFQQQIIGTDNLVTTIKIEPVPYSFLEGTYTVKLLFQNKQGQKVSQQIFDNINIVDMFDQNFVSVQKLIQQQQQNSTYLPPSVCYLEISAPRDTVLKLKQLETIGTFIVLKSNQ